MKKNDEFCEVEKVHDDIVERVKKQLPSDDTVSDLAELFKVFGDYTRTRILSCLEYGELCVCDICCCLDMTKSAISHQLRILRQAKLVKSRRSGKEVFYSLDDDHVSEIYECALSHIKEERK